jgi:hypothetical protein
VFNLYRMNERMYTLEAPGVWTQLAQHACMLSLTADLTRCSLKFELMHHSLLEKKRSTHHSLMRFDFYPKKHNLQRDFIQSENTGTIYIYIPYLGQAAPVLTWMFLEYQPIHQTICWVQEAHQPNNGAISNWLVKGRRRVVGRWIFSFSFDIT